MANATKPETKHHDSAAAAECDSDEKKEVATNNDHNLTSRIYSFCCDERQATVSHNMLVKTWREQGKFDGTWIDTANKNKDTSKLYAVSLLSGIKMDPYGTKHLNSIWYRHPNFDLSRRSIQHDIIDIFVDTPRSNSCVSNQRPWIIFIGGASCIGKSFMVSQLKQHKLLPELDNECCVVDNHDLIRPLLPEWELYQQDKDKTSLYQMLYVEVVYLFGCIMWRGMEKGKNVLIDGTMKNYPAYKRFLSIIGKHFAQYKVGFIFVEPKKFDINAITKRLDARSKATGRQTPIEIVKDSYEKSKVTYNKLRAEFEVDLAMRVVNEGEDVDVMRTEVAFDHIGFECKLKDLVTWQKKQSEEQSLLQSVHGERFSKQIKIL